ncbi:MAG: flagellar motor switch protein FliN [Deltaproteobacteria bacterium]|nr:flagellar motor switch protein FliN [Deltaproteobacteria bacterium]
MKEEIPNSSHPRPANRPSIVPLAEDRHLPPSHPAGDSTVHPTERRNAAALDRILDVSVQLTVELGRKRMQISEVLALEPGSTIEFPKAADEPLDIRINDRLVARGEAVVMGDRYGVRITEVIDTQARAGSGTKRVA